MERLIHLLLFSGLCLFPQSISCQYILIQQPMSWDTAQAYCRQNYFDLATVQSDEDWTYLQQSAMASAAWIGLYNDLNSWRWSYQDENVTFTYWYSTQPNNQIGTEECATTYSLGWFDRTCNDKYPFLCFNETETGSNRFILNTTAMTWSESQIYCRQHYTDLATIRTQADNDLVTTMIGSIDRVWIGLFRDSWKWSNGVKVANKSSITWKTGQPDMLGISPPCGMMGSDGLIEDQLCSTAFPFICDIHAKKQILRAEIKSGLNVNDPVVMEKILQLIKQKLKDHGIEKDTRVTWRLQPDGNVFSPKHDEDIRAPVKCPS